MAEKQAPTFTVKVSFPSWLPSRGIDRVLLAGLALVIIQVIWRGFIVRDAYFAHDDYNYMTMAFEEGLDPDRLTTLYFGHFMPGVFALAWALVSFEPYSWFPTAATTLFFQAWASLGMLALLRRMFGPRPGILVPLIIYLFSPLTLHTFIWWAAAVQALPLQVAIIMALLSHVRYLDTGRRLHAALAVVWFIFGLAFFEKAVAIPLVLGAVSWLFYKRSPREHLRLWLMYAGLLVAYVAVYLSRPDSTDKSALHMPDAGATADLVRLLLGETFPTTIVGGPLTWVVSPPFDMVHAPSPLLTIVSWVVIVIVVLASLVYRRGAGKAWLLLLAYLLYDVTGVVLGRDADPEQAGLFARYFVDAAPLLAICLAMAYLPLRGETDPYRRALPDRSSRMLAVGLATGTFVAACIASTQNLVSDMQTEPTREYVANVREGLEKSPPGREIYPTYVPKTLMDGLFMEDRITSRVMAPLASRVQRERMKNPQPTVEPYFFDERGRLRRMGVYGALVGPPPFKKCFPVRGGQITVPIRIDGGNSGVAGLGYNSPGPARLQVQVDAERRDLFLPAGKQSMYFPVRTHSQQMTITVVSAPKGFCLEGASAGYPAPAPVS